MEPLNDRIRAKEFCFFCINEYEAVIPKKMASLGYKVNINRITRTADVLVAMGVDSSIEMEKVRRNQNSLQGKPEKEPVIIHNCLDIPYWRLNEKIYRGYYDNYRRILESADYVTAISNETAKMLNDLWGIKAIKQLSYFRNEEIERFNFRDEKKNQIISMARFVPHKRLDLLLEALGVIRYPGKVLITGTSGHMKEIYKKIAERDKLNLEIKENVPYEHVIKELKASRLCVLPTVFEGLGCPSMESIWSDVPFIGADIPVKREIHGDTIILVKPDNVLDLAKTIQATLDGTIKIDMSAAKEKLKEYTLGSCVEKFREFLKTEVFANEYAGGNKPKKDNRYNSK